MSAGLACALLFGAVAWNIYEEEHHPVATIENGATDSTMQTSEELDLLPISRANAALLTPVTPLGANILSQAILEYDNATKGGASSEIGIAAVQKFGESILPTVEYKRYASSDIRTDSESSSDRVLEYRADLRVALEPLLENKEYELDIFANYVETKDKKYLARLRAAAANYDR